MTREQLEEQISGDPHTFPRWFTGTVTIDGKRRRVVEGYVQGSWVMGGIMFAIGWALLLFLLYAAGSR